MKLLLLILLCIVVLLFFSREEFADSKVIIKDKKAVGTKAVDTKAVDTKAVDKKAVDKKAVDTKAVDTKAVDTNVIDTNVIDTNVIDTNVIDLDKNYKIFVDIYNTFMINWEKALITLIGLNNVSPDAATNATTDAPTKPAMPSRNEINLYIKNLTSKLNMILPEVTDPFPKTIDVNKIDPTLLKKIPSDPIPYINALTWINTNLEKTHRDLESAMKGKKTEGFYTEGFYTEEYTIGEHDIEDFGIEGFDTNEMCQQYLSCQQQNEQQIQQSINTVLLNFINNKQLLDAFARNKELIAKSEKIKKQAESGDLLKQLQLPDEEIIKYELPDGHDALNDMEKNDPAKYKEYKSKYSQWFGIKQLFDQINSNLR